MFKDIIRITENLFINKFHVELYYREFTQNIKKTIKILKRIIELYNYDYFLLDCDEKNILIYAFQKTTTGLKFNIFIIYKDGVKRFTGFNCTPQFIFLEKEELEDLQKCLPVICQILPIFKKIKLKIIQRSN